MADPCPGAADMGHSWQEGGEVGSGPQRHPPILMTLPAVWPLIAWGTWPLGSPENGMMSLAPITLAMTQLGPGEPWWDGGGFGVSSRSLQLAFSRAAGRHGMGAGSETLTPPPSHVHNGQFVALRPRSSSLLAEPFVNSDEITGPFGRVPRRAGVQPRVTSLCTHPSAMGQTTCSPEETSRCGIRTRCCFSIVREGRVSCSWV